MEFIYSQQDACSSAEAPCFLLWNGLGGYSSLTGSFAAPRADQGLLVAALKAPNDRFMLVHRLQEALLCGTNTHCLSSQEFTDGTAPEDGFRYLSRFSFAYVPRWEYEAAGIRVVRQCCMAYGSNTAAVIYDLHNPTQQPCTLQVTPFFKFAPKETALTERMSVSLEENRVICGDHTLYIHTDGQMEATPLKWQSLSYPEDAKDGRPAQGLAAACCQISLHIAAGSSARMEIVFSTQSQELPAQKLLDAQIRRLQALELDCGLSHPIARQLARSADAYIAHRDSTGGKTILAGYPLFSDWGRDTMIAMPGCTLSTGRLADAKSILRTFLAYEKDGLIPNLFPEGEQQPIYNTADAALLLIDCVWQYLNRSGDQAFLLEAFPVMERIVNAYKNGTHHAIGMDTDGLISAGQGLDQVTWMDVCIQGILPTPRHGKPVEINAYWYNALKIMEQLAPQAGADGSDYGTLAELVCRSFNEKFFMEDKGCLKDVLSGTDADHQIRCNQIWALSMSFTMLPAYRERQVLEAVRRHLLTDRGLRTLSAEDPQYHPFYGGDQYHRDMAYHQGTTWVFPMGAYYRAYLRIYGKDALQTVKAQLEQLIPMLKQGCAGQLPEIYDGTDPYAGKGCFAQAWSVGEILRVYEDIQNIEENSL